jgi:protein gp37
MNRTKIEWCDYTWNPIVGCSPVSEGCANCYAAAISKRFKLPWGKPVFKRERLDEPAKVKKPSRIFVCSMSDVFHPDVRLGWQIDVLGRIANDELHRNGHAYIVLTKRPDIMKGVLAQILEGSVLSNLWIGVTAENQARADERIPILLSVPAAVRFVSVEPMLGPVDLFEYLWSPHQRLDWVIAGPETGPKARQFYREWIDMPYDCLGLCNQCTRYGVPFFDKREPFIRREWPK